MAVGGRQGHQGLPGSLARAPADRCRAPVSGSAQRERALRPDGQAGRGGAFRRPPIGRQQQTGRTTAPALIAPGPSVRRRPTPTQAHRHRPKGAAPRRSFHSGRRGGEETRAVSWYVVVDAYISRAAGVSCTRWPKSRAAALAIRREVPAEASAAALRLRPDRHGPSAPRRPARCLEETRRHAGSPHATPIGASQATLLPLREDG